MNRRELNISDKSLHEDTKEDIILKSPLRIPPKGLQDLIRLKGVNNNSYAYYDLSETEKVAINILTYPPIFFNDIKGHTKAEAKLYMGSDFIDI